MFNTKGNVVGVVVSAKLSEITHEDLVKASKGKTPKEELRKIINNATYELKCWASGKRIKAAKMK